jgi:hypothetical protein
MRPALTILTIGSLFILFDERVSAQLSSSPAEVVNAVVAYRTGWMRDSTTFDACSVFKALAEPADFPAAVEPRFRHLLSTHEHPCSDMGPQHGPISVHRVTLDSLVLHDTTGTAFLHVTHGEKRHGENVELVRRGGRWWVSEVRLWGSEQVYPSRPAAPAA